jgi:hypothetical protein
MSATIKLRDAIKQMRRMSSLNIPFSFSYITYSEQTQSSDGLKTVDKGLIRKGYRSNQSDKSNLLIAYTDYSSNEDKRQFYLPLLMTFNNQLIQT